MNASVLLLRQGRRELPGEAVRVARALGSNWARGYYRALSGQSTVKQHPSHSRYAQQVVAFRLSRLGLRRRVRGLSAAVGYVGLPDFPPGSALAALALRLSNPFPHVLAEAFEARSLVRLRAMRGAPVVADTADYDIFALGMLPRDERSMRAFLGAAAKSAAAAGFSALEAVELVAQEAADALSQQLLDRDTLHAELASRNPFGRNSRRNCRP